MWIDKSILIVFAIIFFFVLFKFARFLGKIEDDIYDIKSIIEDKSGDHDLDDDKFTEK